MLTVMDWIMSPPPPEIDTLKSQPPVSQHVTALGDENFKEVIKVKWGQIGEP